MNSSYNTSLLAPALPQVVRSVWVVRKVRSCSKRVCVQLGVVEQPAVVVRQLQLRSPLPRPHIHWEENSTWWCGTFFSCRHGIFQPVLHLQNIPIPPTTFCGRRKAASCLWVLFLRRERQEGTECWDLACTASAKVTTSILMLCTEKQLQTLL